MAATVLAVWLLDGPAEGALRPDGLQRWFPPGGRCDIKTLAIEAAVDRTAFYGTRPYAHLREEFEPRLRALQQAGEVTDPREAQIARLKAEVTALKERLARSAGTIDVLPDFRTRALARLAAQHEEIVRLRRQADQSGSVRRLRTRISGAGSCS